MMDKTTKGLIPTVFLQAAFLSVYLPTRKIMIPIVTDYKVY